jgi:hypothetical protein
MGMYDNIRCEYPLPDGYEDRGEFQSKSLDCSMATYLITKEGKLVQEHAGSWGEERGPEGELNFTGSVGFYDSNLERGGQDWVLTGDGLPYAWREYTALFQEGKLLSLTGGVVPDAHYANKRLVTREEAKELEARDAVEREKARAKADNDDHQRAMELAEQADREPDPKKRADLFYEAAELESSRARKCHENPTQTILYRSAAQLWLEAGHPWESLNGIAEWMQFNRRDSLQSCPAEIKAEIAYILRKVADLL